MGLFKKKPKEEPKRHLLATELSYAEAMRLPKIYESKSQGDWKYSIHPYPVDERIYLVIGNERLNIYARFLRSTKFGETHKIVTVGNLFGSSTEVTTTANYEVGRAIADLKELGDALLEFMSMAQEKMNEVAKEEAQRMLDNLSFMNMNIVVKECPENDC